MNLRIQRDSSKHHMYMFLTYVHADIQTYLQRYGRGYAGYTQTLSLSDTDISNALSPETITY